MSKTQPRVSPLSRRLSWMNLFVSGSALLLASVAFLAYDQFTFRQTLVRNLSAQAQIIGSNSVSALTFNDPQAAENTLSALRSFPEILAAGIYAADGHVFARYSPDPSQGVIAVVTLRSSTDEVVESRSDEVFLVRPIIFQGKKIGAVYIRSSLTALSHRFWRYILIAAIVLLVSLIVALLISSVYRHALVGPIVNLAQTAQSVSEEKNYSLRATPVEDKTEIGLLIDAFNDMLKQIQVRDQALLRAQGELEQRVQQRTQQLVAANHELEAFSYSVSHDLRGPLQTMNGFVHMLATDYESKLDNRARDYLRQLRLSSRRMSELIEDLLNLSRVSTTGMQAERVDLSELAKAVASNLQSREPARQVEFMIANCPAVEGDTRLLQIVMENLLNNAWKYTSAHAQARIEFGCEKRAIGTVYFVRDDGAGFDARQADRLFKPFQRLHSEAEFPGTGIGLATVQRIVQRHGGRIWGESAGHGATFYFALDPVK
ncbi:MAG TPA: ATP-binding protein [Candidatus Angelobacter sp.]